MSDELSSCELPASAVNRSSGSRIMRFQDGFRWHGVSVEEYKDPADHWCGISRQLFIGERGEQTQFALRYFEIEPGGYSSLEAHQHEHAVFVLRGEGRVQLGDDHHQIRFGDVVYVAPNETHQFRNPSKSEPFGFLCVVDVKRDRPVVKKI